MKTISFAMDQAFSIDFDETRKGIFRLPAAESVCLVGDSLCFSSGWACFSRIARELFVRHKTHKDKSSSAHTKASHARTADQSVECTSSLTCSAALSCPSLLLLAESKRMQSRGLPELLRTSSSKYSRTRNKPQVKHGKHAMIQNHS